MDYEFPYIQHLDEVREAIADSPEFVVAEREWGYVVNYLVITDTTFPPVITLQDAIRRECRGLCFDRNGNLISRPFSKFWNVNERDETQVHQIDLARPHVILEKLDGSMVRPIPLGDGYRLATKMGISDVAMQAEEFVAENINYHDFIMLHIERGQTPIFEWCSRKQRIVIDYPQDRLVLTGIRNVNDGAYKSYAQMVAYAAAYGIEVVQARAGTADNMQNLLEETRALQGQEGWIIRFDDGHMLKIKSDDYLKIHKAKDNITRENRLIELLLDEKLDDIKSFLPKEDRVKIDQYEHEFLNGIRKTANNWESMNIEMRRRFGNDRKGFALFAEESNFDGYLKNGIFKSWDGSNFDWQKFVLEIVRKNLGSATKVSEIRYLFGNANWNYRNYSE